jgi:hypothetical protein
MELRRRFVFRGNAAAIGGRIVRPADTILDSVVASSLTVVGGRSTARAGPARFGAFVSFASAATSAEGLFDDVKKQIDFTLGTTPEDALTTTTRVSADVTALSIGDKLKLTIQHLHASLNSRSPGASGEPPIGVGNDTVIDGVAIDGHVLNIELALPVFQQNDTRAKLLTAVNDPQFVRDFGECLYITPTPAGAVAPPAAARLQYGSGTIYATIVKSIKWAGVPFQGAVIDHNMVSVPNFGKIFFGEILITGQSRRLTMLRTELGSEVGGAVACAEVEDNGTWSN